EATCGGGSEPTTVDRILERLAWLLEQGRRPCLTRRKFDAGEKSGMLHPFDQDRPSPIVDDGDDAGPMIALRLRFGSGDHFARGGQGDDFLVGELRRGTAGDNG